MSLFKQLENIIRNNNSFLLTTHVNPDADAVGSEMALYHLLKRMGKDAVIINHNETPDNIQFLDPENVIQKFDRVNPQQIIDEIDVIIFLDLNQITRVASMTQKLRSSSKIKVVIDHHQDADNFADLMITDTNANATGEILYNFILQSKLTQIDYEIALPIYAAIVTDTGSFRYERMNPNLHLIASELLKAGIVPHEVADKIYDQSRLSKIKLLGYALSTMVLSESGNIAYMLITTEALENSGAFESEVDGFVNYCLAIKGVKVGILFFELKDGIKVSFRSKGMIPMNKLAAEFEGGGHTNAAATRLFNVKMEDYLKKIINKAEECISEYSNK